MIDDLDGSTGDVSTVAFHIDGVDYEIDLSATNARRLRDALAEYVAASRSIAGTPSTSVRSRDADRATTAAIRAWAREAGRAVAARGRIPEEIVSAYHHRADPPQEPIMDVTPPSAEVSARVKPPLAAFSG